MAMGERAAFAVLTGDAHRVAFGEQGSEGESFTEAPVDVGAGLVGFGLRIEESLDLGIRSEVRRGLPEHRRDLVQQFARSRRVDGVFVGRAERTDAHGPGLTFFDFRRDRRLGAFLRGVEQYVKFGAQGDELAVGGRLGFGQAGGVEFRHARVRGDLLVEHRLGEGRFVGLIVAVATIADDIQHGVGAELLAELEGDFGGEHDRVGIVAVGVEDRALGELGDLGAMAAGARLVRIRGEADLVVRDDMERAAHLVALEAGEVERLHDDSLAGERGVAVEQDGQDLRTVGAALEVDERAGAAEDDRVDGFEVAGVEGEGDADFLAFDDARAGVAEVILHVAVTMRGVRDMLFGEAGEEGFGLLAADVDEDV